MVQEIYEQPLGACFNPLTSEIDEQVRDEQHRIRVDGDNFATKARDGRPNLCEKGEQGRREANNRGNTNDLCEEIQKSHESTSWYRDISQSYSKNTPAAARSSEKLAKAPLAAATSHVISRKDPLQLRKISVISGKHPSCREKCCQTRENTTIPRENTNLALMSREIANPAKAANLVLSSQNSAGTHPTSPKIASDCPRTLPKSPKTM